MPKFLYLFGFLLFISCGKEEAVDAVPTANYHIIAYVFGSKPVVAANINAQYLTHINYAFAEVVDNKVVGYLSYDTENYKALHSLKEINPDLKILVSIGGWGKSNGFSDAALTDTSRATFVKSAIDYLEQHQLDGIDLDWEYPAQRGAGNIYRAVDKSNFTFLLRDMRAALNEIGLRDQKEYLLTIATGANQRYLDLTEMDQAQQYLDFINIMSYDFVTGSSDTTAHQANLFPSNTIKASHISVSESVAWHQAAGIPIEKLVMGVPFYGRRWMGVDSTAGGLHQASTSGGGGVSYHQIMDYLEKDKTYQRYWDEEAQAPYLWHPGDRQFITYDDPQTLQRKADFIKEKGMGGAMFWQYGSDTTGTLLKALYEGLEK
jgi:chitinase